jgi:hypothetical protein
MVQDRDLALPETGFVAKNAHRNDNSECFFRIAKQLQKHYNSFKK